jgi:hypothetical protein
VDGHGLIHVNHDKVIVTSLGSRELSRRELRRLSNETKESGDVGLLLGSGYIAPDVGISCQYLGWT